MPAPASQAKTYTLSGTVVSSVTGDPVPHALVNISAGTGRATLTGIDGRFEFSSLPAIQVTISAHKPGYFSDQELSQGPPVTPPSIVQVGPDSSQVVVRLTPQGVISGRIESGTTPVEHLPVRILALRIAGGHRRWEQRATTVTDDDGEFRASGLPPGSYYVEIGPGLEFDDGQPGERTGVQGESRQANEAEEGYGELFYPGAPEISAASPIELAGGQQVVANFSVKSLAVVTISGTVMGFPQGQGVSLQLETNSRPDISFPTRFDAQTGSFVIKAAEGQYRLRAVAQGPGGEVLQAETAVDATADRADLRLLLAPQPSIPVVVSLEPSSLQSGSAESRPAGRRTNSIGVHLIRQGPSLRATDYWSESNRGSDPLAIRGVEPGTYVAEFTPAPPWHVLSATCGDVDLLRDELTVSAGAQTAPIEIVLRDDSASLGGTISSEGEPVTAAVVLVPQRAPRQPTVAVGYAGNEFEFGNLAPGDYSVFAVNRLDGLEYADPEVLQPYLTKATRVTLEANRKANVNLEVVEPGN